MIYNRFFVDDTPVRVFKNNTGKGGSYPTKAMRITATIWTDTWASNGFPVNWNDAPFEAHYRGFSTNSACQILNTTSSSSSNQDQCHSSEFWWNANEYWGLNSLQKQAYHNVRSKYLNYDYCAKKAESPECNW